MPSTGKDHSLRGAGAVGEMLAMVFTRFSGRMSFVLADCLKSPMIGSNSEAESFSSVPEQRVKRHLI